MAQTWLSHRVVVENDRHLQDEVQGFIISQTNGDESLALDMDEAKELFYYLKTKLYPGVR